MSTSWQHRSALSPEERLDVLALMDRLESLLGREAIDESRRRTVVHGWRGEHWLRYDVARLLSYAQVTGDEVATVEMVGGGFDRELLARVLDHHDVLDWWTRGPLDIGLTGGEIVRTLQLMRVQLPVALTAPPVNSRMLNFDPSRDSERWLAQNNSAFADHPEQGAWTLQDVKERAAEPWFDPSGFLLLEIDEQLAASCWTKVHELHPDRFGEIYVISVDPMFQGRGLGRVMVTQGLDALRRKGVSQAVLFVDESNLSAKRLYESLGFELQREDRLLRFARETSVRTHDVTDPVGDTG